MIHPSAVVAPQARIADDCEIGPFCIIGPDVEIGPGCKICSHTIVSGLTTIGRNNTIYSFSSVGEAPQDMKYKDEKTRLVLGDNNTIREYVTLHRGTAEGGGVTNIGSDNLLMAYTHVAHDCAVGNNVIMSNAASLAGHVVIEDHVILSGFTCVHQFSRMGTHSFSGMSAVINRDVPPYVLVAGHNARAISINKKGLQRRGFTDATIAALQKTFRLLIKSRTSRQRAIEQLRPLAEEFGEVRRLIDFVLDSKRSVVR